MRRSGSAVLLLFCMIGAVAQQSSPNDQQLADQQHGQWIEMVMNSFSAIKPGTARKDLPHSVVSDGGLSFRTQGRFVYRHCRYIKVDIEFQAVDERSEFSPEDKVVKVSRPYLEYPFSD